MLIGECQIQGWMNGTPDVTPAMATDAILPGRALAPGGKDIELGTKMRAYGVANFFVEHDLLSREGLIVCSADRTPADNEGDEWRDPETNRVFPYGISEAEGYRRTLINDCGIPRENIVKQEGSFETVGDIWRGQLALMSALKVRGIDLSARVVILAAQQTHLESIMEDIAPRVMRMKYIGAVIPEEDPNDPDSFSRMARPIRRRIARGLGSHQAVDTVSHKIEKRARFYWTVALLGDKLLGGRSAIGPASVEAPSQN